MTRMWDRGFFEPREVTEFILSDTNLKPSGKKNSQVVAIALFHG